MNTRSSKDNMASEKCGEKCNTAKCDTTEKMAAKDQTEATKPKVYKETYEREYEYHSKGGHYEAHDKAAHKINDQVVYDRDLTEKDGQISGAEHKFGIEGDKTAATKQLKDTKDTRI